MAKHDEYYVEPRGDEWIVKKPHADEVSAILPNPDQAIAKAKAFAPEGVVNVKGRDGKFRRG